MIVVWTENGTEQRSPDLSPNAAKVLIHYLRCNGMEARVLWELQKDES
jgi:hypothetical protein